MSLNRILDNSLLLDLETLQDNRLTKIGAVYRGESLEKKGRFNHADALRQLDAMAESAEFVLWNLRGRWRLADYWMLGRRTGFSQGKIFCLLTHTLLRLPPRRWP